MKEIDTLKLTSVLANFIFTYIKEKHDDKIKFVRGTYELVKFDLYCTNQKLISPIIDEDFINFWIKENGGTTRISHTYYSVVRNFTFYLHDINNKNYAIPFKNHNYIYTSVLESIIKNFIIYKRNIGYKYIKEESVLYTVDSFCSKQQILNLKEVTCNLFEEWYLNSIYKKNYHYLIRELCIYMKIQEGIDIEIPDSLVKLAHPSENYEYKSVFKNLLNDFIEEKKQCGYKYDSERKILKYFDLLCIEMNIKSTELTKEIVVKWSFQKDKEKKSYTNKRISIIRQFAKYLISYNIRAYIAPPNVSLKPKPPHIFKKEELIEFFKCVDNYPSTKVYIKLTLPVIFRFYYSLGLRLNEAINIKCTDIDFSSGKILIRMAKNLKDRFVYMPDDLQNVAQKYDERVKTTIQERKFFFVTNILGTKFLDSDLCDMFNRTWNTTKYADMVERKPTIHSFRHSMVVKRLECWYQQDVDYNEKLPYLSAFLGHANIESTFYYVHLVESAFPLIRAKMAQFEDLYPEDEK